MKTTENEDLAIKLKSKPRTSFTIFVSIFIPFIAVLLAFRLDSWRNQKILDENTNIKINLMEIELDVNKKKVMLYYNNLKNLQSNSFTASRLETRAAIRLTEDENIYRLFDFRKLYLLHTYIYMADVINNTNERYFVFIGHPERTKEINISIRSDIREMLSEYVSIVEIMGKEYKQYAKGMHDYGYVVSGLDNDIYGTKTLLLEKMWGK